MRSTTARRRPLPTWLVRLLTPLLLVLGSVVIWTAPASAYNALPCDANGPQPVDASLASQLNPQLNAKMRGHLNAYNMSCARMVVQTVHSRGFPVRAAQIAIATIIVETSMANLDGGHGTSVGLFQQIASWGSFGQRTNPVWATNAFLNEMLRLVPDWQALPVGVVCQRVQRSAYPDRYEPEAHDGGVIAGALWALMSGPPGPVAGPMYHRVRNAEGTDWSSFQPLAGAGTTQHGTAFDMAITAMPDGSAQVLIVGGDNTFYHQVRSRDGHWSGFLPLMGGDGTQYAKGSRVSIAGMPDGSAQALVVGADGGLYHRVRNKEGTAWSPFAPVMGGDGTQHAKGSDVAITATPDGSAHVLIVGADGGLYHQVRNPEGRWSGFLPLMGGDGTQHAKGSRVTIAGMPDGSVHVVVIGADGGLYHRVRNREGTGWSSFVPVMGGDGTQHAKGSDVSIAAMPDGSAQLLIVGGDGGFYHRIVNAAGEWTPFLPLMGGDGTQHAKGSQVSIAGMPDGSAQIAVVGQ